jgi:antitoxin HicB
MGAFDPSEYGPEVLELVWQPWTIEVKPYPDGGYFARVVELPGCMTEADSAAEVLEALEEARAEWITVALEHGQKIPAPVGASEYSGKIFARTSPALHRLVAEEAARHGVSMSQWISEVLAREVGLHEAIDRSGGSDIRQLLEALSDRETAVFEALQRLFSETEEQHPKSAADSR